MMFFYTLSTLCTVQTQTILHPEQSTQPILPIQVLRGPSCFPPFWPMEILSSYSFSALQDSLSQFKNLLRLRQQTNSSSYQRVGGVFLCSHFSLLFCLRPIMLYQIPWPLERSRRWTRYMPLLNVNNHSLTSTSECVLVTHRHATRSDLTSWFDVAVWVLFFFFLDLWDASIFTRTKRSRSLGGWCAISIFLCLYWYFSWKRLSLIFY